MSLLHAMAQDIHLLNETLASSLVGVSLMRRDRRLYSTNSVVQFEHFNQLRKAPIAKEFLFPPATLASARKAYEGKRASLEAGRSFAGARRPLSRYNRRPYVLPVEPATVSSGSYRRQPQQRRGASYRSSITLDNKKPPATTS